MNEFFQKCRYYFKYAFFFSMFINVLQLTFSIYMLLIFDKVLASYNLPTLWVITIGALLALSVLAILEWIRSRLLVRAGIAFDEILSRPVLDNSLANASLPIGEDRGATLQDVQILRNFLGSPAIFAYADLPWIPLFLLIVFVLHPLMGLVGLFGMVTVLTFGFVTERVARKRLESADDINADTVRFLGTAMDNAPIIRAMGMNPNVTSRWQKFNDVVVSLQSRVTFQTGILQSIGKSCRMSIQVLTYGTGAYLAVTHVATPGIMIAGSVIIGRALSPIDQGMASYKQALRAWKSYKDIKRTLSVPPSAVADKVIEAPRGAVEVDDVRFSVREHDIIKGLSFSLPAGQSMALIGPSAAGKSTLCQLLLGIWRPTSGVVRIDGEDLAELDPRKLGPHLGYLPQTIELFPGSVSENIARMGRPDPTKVVEAATLAGVHDLILHLPGGYDTPIYGPGFVLSGGQRQRIGLARALYGSPKLVVLDEPNANLDEEGDLSLLQTVKRLQEQQITLVLVTHKLNILNQVDIIMVLEGGEIRMAGPRQAILNQMRAGQPPPPPPNFRTASV
ncbi:type I secretion system permease/ATPase [Desulfosarcina sp. OttesenSCG-928-G10]|nr:type I secretion system permease/ATPase [Desulfosarcina sp. OttesenSCG-928-G10]MDL2321109.1 type I secretion system permease/ATPase [Desulfosarcina sp. OttesenSCG-928-B08]